VARAGRLVFLLLLARWTFVFLAWPMREDVIGASFLHLINLPFHEAGHILFSPFGDFMTTLGGSLMQVLVPIICGIAFLTTHWNPFGAAVMGWWAGENLMDVAVYINDARTLQLTLLGGQTGAEVEGHDWERILTLTNSLHLDHRLAAIAQWLGAAAMVACLIWGLVVALKTKEESWLSGTL
jgi:hypothetical protein